VPRSGEEARRRLQEAALDLYRRRGYDATTTAEIAAEAGVTERTFFRHFADKREVFFDGEATLRAKLEKAIAEVPGSPAPLDVVQHAFRSVAPFIESNRSISEPRHPVIAATPALYERQLAKTAALTKAMAEALEMRGVPSTDAALAADVGMAAFGHAARLWWEDPADGLEALVIKAFAEVRKL